MPAASVLQQFQLSLAVVVLVMSAGAFLWALVRIVQKPAGPYFDEIIAVVWVTGCSLSVLKYLASPDTRHELEALSTVGTTVWVTSAVLLLVLRRRQSRGRTTQSPPNRS